MLLNMKSSSAVGIRVPGGKRHDRVRQSPRIADDGDRTISQAIELTQPAWLVLRRHEKHVGPAFDSMGKAFIKANTKSELSRVTVMERFEALFQGRLAGPQNDKLQTKRYQFRNRFFHQVESLLRSHAADERYDRLIRVRKVEFSSQGVLAETLRLPVCRGIRRRQVRIGFRIPEIDVDPV